MLTLDLQLDYAYLCNREPVVLLRRAATFDLNSQVTPIAIADAVRVGSSHAEAEPSGGRYQRGQVGFKLPYPQVTLPPRPGDWIEDAGHDLWTILGVGHPRLKSLWTVNCVRVAVEALGTTIGVWDPKDKTDVATSPLTEHQQEGSMIPAAIQLFKSEKAEYQRKSGFRRWYWIWTPLQIDPDYGALLKDNRNNVYQVEQVEDHKKLDSLLKITAVINP